MLFWFIFILSWILRIVQSFHDGNTSDSLYCERKPETLHLAAHAPTASIIPHGVIAGTEADPCFQVRTIYLCRHTLSMSRGADEADV